MDKKEKIAIAGVTIAGLTGLGLYLYLRSKKVSAISTPTTTGVTTTYTGITTTTSPIPTTTYPVSITYFTSPMPIVASPTPTATSPILQNISLTITTVSGSSVTLTNQDPEAEIPPSPQYNLTMSNAEPNTTYVIQGVVVCPDSSPSYVSSKITTDSTGSGQATLQPMCPSPELLLSVYGPGIAYQFLAYSGTPVEIPASYGEIIGPITSDILLKIDSPQVLVVAVGGGGGGAGTNSNGGNGGDTIVTNGYQIIYAYGGQGGVSTSIWFDNASTASGGSGLAENVQYYRILNGNSGGAATIYSSTGGQGAALPSGYQQAIQQVLQEATGINYSIPLTIPSTPCQPPVYGQYGGSPARGFGAGGCGQAVSGEGGGGGGSGGIVVALMNGGTFFIVVGQGGQPAGGTSQCPTGCDQGMPGVVYLIPLP
ncbi:MAG: hypothetical protein QW430_12425 [Metallosphaera sp.]|uniref:glycine-rich domain-containing protein n=1 Tax=Metallosphaera sp. TaxID=2020860 RepID=UPI00315E1869